MTHNKRWIAVLVIALLLALVAAAHAETRVWGLYGWLDNVGGSSKGIDQIAAQARRIPGVTSVTVHNYWETVRTANEIMAAPKTARIVIYGYSCGSNSTTAIVLGLAKARTIHAIAVIQMSTWCGGYPVTGNVLYAQETLNSNCLLTLGFGCKKIQPGAGFQPHNMVLINRPDSHGYADDDPDTQRDVLGAIRRVAVASNAKLGAPRGRPGYVTEVTRRLGQRL